MSNKLYSNYIKECEEKKLKQYVRYPKIDVSVTDVSKHLK